MKAVDFVKKFGWDDAIALVNASNICGIDKSIVDIEELKRLVESHELVEKHGGLGNAKDEYFSCVQNNEPASHIAKAITNVESCQ